MPNENSVAEKKAAHTPGPWGLGSPTVTRHDYPEPYDSETVSVRGANGAGVASIYGGHQHVPFVSIDEYRANARLIAAAPELLEACLRLLKFNEELATDVNVSTHYPSADFARTAIAKAKGGAR